MRVKKDVFFLLFGLLTYASKAGGYAAVRKG